MKYIGTDSPLYEKEWKNYDFTAELDQSPIVDLEDQARWILSSGINNARKTHVSRIALLLPANDRVSNRRIR